MRNEVKLFLAGIKPAMLVSDRKSEAIAPILLGLPKIEMRTSTMYFQNEEQKKRFLEKDGVYFNDDGSVRMINARTLGTELGYPPQAVEYFCGRWYKERVEVCWHDIHFICHPSQTSSCIEWMNRRYKVGEELQSGVWTRPLKDFDIRIKYQSPKDGDLL